MAPPWRGPCGHREPRTCVIHESPHGPAGQVGDRVVTGLRSLPEGDAVAPRLLGTLPLPHLDGCHLSVEPGHRSCYAPPVKGPSRRECAQHFPWEQGSCLL